MDLNPVFTSSTTFRPATTGGELALFSSAGIVLVHGWLVDPESPEYAAVSRVKDYDSAMNLMVEADVLTRGLLMGNGAGDDWDGPGPSQAGPSDSGVNLSEEERRKVEDGELSYLVPGARRACSHSHHSPAPLNPTLNLHLHHPTRVLPPNPTHHHRIPSSLRSSATLICQCCIGMVVRCTPS